MTHTESSLLHAMTDGESSLLHTMTCAKQLYDNDIVSYCLVNKLIILSLNPELFLREEERRDEFTVCF